MKWLIYAAVVAAAVLVPVERSDVGMLLPIETVLVYEEGERVIIKTEMDDLGMGNTLETALQDLEDTTPGIVYLDTAEYLIIGQGGERHVEKMKEILKSNVRVCKTEDKLDLEKATAYLDAHRPEQKLKDYHGASNLQTLTVEQDRIKLK